VIFVLKKLSFQLECHSCLPPPPPTRPPTAPGGGSGRIVGPSWGSGRGPACQGGQSCSGQSPSQSDLRGPCKLTRKCSQCRPGPRRGRHSSCAQCAARAPRRRRHPAVRLSGYSSSRARTHPAHHIHLLGKACLQTSSCRRTPARIQTVPQPASACDRARTTAARATGESVRPVIHAASLHPPLHPTYTSSMPQRRSAPPAAPPKGPPSPQLKPVCASFFAIQWLF
jgi:hypothetical protein